LAIVLSVLLQYTDSDCPFGIFKLFFGNFVIKSETYPWSFVTKIFDNGQPSHGGDRNIFEVMTSTLPKGTLGLVVSLLAATLYQGNPDRNNKLWNIVSSERYILHMQVLLECCYI
jgi:hypothetical protein